MYVRMDAADVRLLSNQLLKSGEGIGLPLSLMIFILYTNNSNTQHNDKRTDSDRCHPEMG